MNAIILFVSILVTITASPWQREKHNDFRRYDSQEEREYRMSSFLWEDENGHICVENLINATFVGRAGDISDITLYLYTKDNPIYEEIIYPNDFLSLILSTYFDATRKNIFIVHGWKNNYQSNINVLIKNALLLRPSDVNVFVLDWSGPANKNYLSAKAAVIGIGAALGDFINRMILHYEISSKDFNLIGHSLGAHVCGCAGSNVENKINYIIGLDPASPLYTLGNTDNRIDPSDADFVQIIHTNAGLLGFSSAIGHADYYPNGGNRQPGCGLDITGSCAHSRSYQYLAESLENSQFTAHNCESYTQYDEGNCGDNHESFLGNYYIDKAAYGDYYLKTNDKEPFAKSA